MITFAGRLDSAFVGKQLTYGGACAEAQIADIEWIMDKVRRGYEVQASALQRRSLLGYSLGAYGGTTCRETK